LHILRGLKPVGDSTLKAIEHVRNLRQIRQARVKIIGAIKFLRICASIGRFPRATARQISQRNWPLTMGPKSFVAVAAALFAIALLFDPTQKFGTWSDVVFDLSVEDQLRFIDAFGITLEEYLRYSTYETIWSGSSPLSDKIMSQTKSLAPDKIAIFVAARDVQLASVLNHEIRYEHLNIKIEHLIRVSSLPLVIFVGGLILHYTAAPSQITRRTSLDLVTYFVGYYLFIFSIFLILAWPLTSPTGILELGVIAIQMVVAVVLTIQFYIFVNAVYQRSATRMVFSITLSGISIVITVVIVALSIAVILKMPILDWVLHQIAEHTFS